VILITFKTGSYNPLPKSWMSEDAFQVFVWDLRIMSHNLWCLS